MAAIATVALAAESTELNKVLEGIAANIVAARGIAATETVEHWRYEKQKNNATCAELVDTGEGGRRGLPSWHDRIRRDVITTGDVQKYALTKPRRLETGDVASLLGGGATGEFGIFLRNIVAGDGEFQQSGSLRTSPDGPAEFRFVVPQTKSHFDYGGAPVGYSGSLLITPGTGGLKRLTLLVQNKDDACRMEYQIDYAAVKTGSREIVLPETSVMDLLYRDGKEVRSETHYSGYYWPQIDFNGPGKSTPPSPLAAGLRLKLRLQDEIDGATSAAGDPVSAVVRSDVKDKSGAIVIHAGDRLHGRIAVLEQFLLKYWQVGGVEDALDPQWNVSIVFESIERGTGSQTVEQPISLRPVDDGDRTPHDAPLTPSALQQLRPPGGGYFRLFRKTLLLDQKFESEWETR